MRARRAGCGYVWLVRCLRYRFGCLGGGSTVVIMDVLRARRGASGAHAAPFNLSDVVGVDLDGCTAKAAFGGLCSYVYRVQPVSPLERK